MNTAILPGSFDPVTVGHLDIIERAAAVFDRLIVCIMVNGGKRPFFSMEERLEFLRAAISHIRQRAGGAYAGQRRARLYRL